MPAGLTHPEILERLGLTRQIQAALKMKWTHVPLRLAPLALALCCVAEATAGEWKPLFNGRNLDGWYKVIRSGISEGTNHLIQVHDGMVHMYKTELEGSPQPSGYMVTSNEFSAYHLRLEYKWGEKRFAPRPKTRRDAGILYHVVGKDGVWPKSVECQIQENDVGDIFTVHTRLATEADPGTTHIISEVRTNEAGLVKTNESLRPMWLPIEKGGVPYVQGVAGDIRRVVRNPMNEHEGWNTVELIVRGDEATYIVNGTTNNHATKIEQMVDGKWVPLNKGKIALQLEFAEVFYRNVEIRELDGKTARKVE
jgi:hypothetical protein